MLRSLAISLLLSLCFGGTVLYGNDSLKNSPDEVEGEYIIHLNEFLKEPVIKDIADDLGVEVKYVFKSAPAILVKNLEREDDQTLDEVAVNHEVIAGIDPNKYLYINEIPNDLGFKRQYAHKKMQSQEAWDYATGNREVVVAVIDTGINYNHPDIQPNYWYNQGELGTDSQGNDKRTNGVDDDGNGYVDDFRGWDFADGDNDPMDELGHGTHCAGIIGAVGNNSEGVVGVNWQVSLVGLKFISKRKGTVAAAIEAIEYAVTMGFDLTSNSWGGDLKKENPKTIELMRAAVASAGKEGQLFVSAAGNNGKSTETNPIIPGAFDLDHIVTVGSTDENDKLSVFSNYGPISVDLMAPGSRILSTYLRRSYKSLSGTSMAAPYVAGAAALLMSVHGKNLSTDRIKRKLMESVDKIPELREKSVTGGRLNLLKLMQ